YAMVPGADDLDRQAEAVGGEHVLAAVLANALYGAAIGVGMLAEGHMLEAGGGAREMTLARDQVLKASGAEGAWSAGGDALAGSPDRNPPAGVGPRWRAR